MQIYYVLVGNTPTGGIIMQFDSDKDARIPEHARDLEQWCAGVVTGQGNTLLECQLYGYETKEDANEAAAAVQNIHTH